MFVREAEKKISSTGGPTTKREMGVGKVFATLKTKKKFRGSRGGEVYYNFGIFELKFYLY